MKTACFVIVGASMIATSADAGFLGFVASVRTSGRYTLVDVFAGVSNKSDRFLNVYDATISTKLANGFFQSSTGKSPGWAPSATSTRASIDSFMTAGRVTYPPAPTVYAGSTTTADPNFVAASWIGTGPASVTSTVPALAGWYTSNPFSADNNAESLAGLVGRVDSGATPGYGATPSTVGSAGAQYGIWVSHLVLQTTQPISFGPNGTVQFSASASIKDGVTGITTQGASAIPAPGAASLLAIAALAGGRRRRN
jgi:MYXO-CTERM domain-containing protein